MRRLTFLALGIVLLGECNAEPEVGDGTGARPTHLLVELTDGSRLVGTTPLKTVSLRTDYTDAEIRLDRLVSLRRAKDASLAMLTMGNGDRLKGELRSEALPLATLLGEVAVPGKHVRAVTVMGAGLPPFEPVACYPLNGGAKDKSKYENHGEVKGATPARDRFGRAGRALRFDGKASYILVKKDVALRKSPGLTLSVWVRDPTAGIIVIQGGWCPDQAPAYRGISFALQLDQPQILAMTAYGGRGNWTDPSNHITSEKSVPQDGQWHHFAGVFDKGVLRLYLDGKLDPASPKYYSNSSGRGRLLPKSRFVEIADSTDSLRIGCGYHYGRRGTCQHFAGDLDDVAIYSRALTGQEIALLAKARPMD